MRQTWLTSKSALYFSFIITSFLPFYTEYTAELGCSKLMDTSGRFSPCHKYVDPSPFKSVSLYKRGFNDLYNKYTPESLFLMSAVFTQRCVYDTCNCDGDTEDCMCAAVSSYVLVCSEKGVHLQDWRKTICGEQNNACVYCGIVDLGFVQSGWSHATKSKGHIFKALHRTHLISPSGGFSHCSEQNVYDYNMTSCQRTCRSLSQPDFSCKVNFITVDGCGCAEGLFMDDKGRCVDSKDCPCYYKERFIPARQTVTKNGHHW